LIRRARPRIRSWQAAVTLGAALAIAAPAAAPAGGRHAGTVLAVDPQARTLTVDEFVGNYERRALRVLVPPEALVVLSRRNPAGRDTRDAFLDNSISLADVRVGDFVVVEVTSDPGIARLVLVTLQRGGS
jgi:hypothetical protein